MDTQEQTLLKKALTYNPITGVFTSNGRRYLGKVVGTVAGGYRQIWFNGKVHRAHRLAFLYMTGAWPKQVDHKNMDRGDNRWSNLREVSHVNNQANSLPRGGTSRFKGVHVGRPHGKFIAKATVGGVTRYLGIFNNEEDAALMYDWFAIERYGNFARLNLPELWGK